jgi:outer membrane lipoprotein-sorting protein
MRKIELFVLILLPFIAVAQEQPKDPKAMALLDKATAAFDSKKGITAEFFITVENTRDNKKESIPGKIWLKGEKFKLSIRDVDTYFDGKTQSVYLKDVQEVTISNPDEEDLKEINPLLLLKSYRAGYKMKFVETFQEGGKLLDVVDLYPEDLKSLHSRITISIEKESMRLHSVRIQGKDGINTVLAIKKYDHTVVPDDVFLFNPNEIKGIEVVDLR